LTLRHLQSVAILFQKSCLILPAILLRERADQEVAYVLRPLSAAKYLPVEESHFVVR